MENGTYSKLVIMGPLASKSTGVNLKDNKAWCRFGFVLKDERGVETIDLFMPQGFDHSSYFEGQEVELPVRCYIGTKGEVRWSYAGDRQAGAARPPVSRPKAVS